MIVELKQNDEVSTLFVKYSGDDTIATGAKFKQKFTAFRFVTTNYNLVSSNYHII